MEPVKQAMRDQAVDVGSAYFKHRAPIPTLTALPETGHTKSPGPLAGLMLYRRAERLQPVV